MSVVFKICDLKEGLEGVTLRVRVLEVWEKKVVETRRGLRTLSEAVVGDETGRVKLTLWGRLAGSLRKGEVVEITNCWITSYRGELQVNAGSSSSVKKLEEAGFPIAEEIPERRPTSTKKKSGPGVGFKSRRDKLRGSGVGYRHRIPK
ncbi:MAG: OB-fold nucleic acid binding domain-containing protein [Acidilobaceae archaeon]